MSRPLPKAAGSPAPVFAALGDETRLRLVTRLSQGEPLSIARLAADEPLSRQAVSKHLRVLAGAGVVRGRRHGREHRWELQPQPILDARRLLERIATQGDDALARLKSAVEQGE